MNEPILFYRAAGKWGFLSNLHPCEIEVELPPELQIEDKHTRVLARSAEHAYQFAKANSHNMREDILGVFLPRSAAILGHGLYPFDVVDGWKEKKLPWMKTVIRAKFRTRDFAHMGAELTRLLLSTGDRQLLEHSKTDSFWGLGPKGEGENHLGKILMEVRDELRQANPSS